MTKFALALLMTAAATTGAMAQREPQEAATVEKVEGLATAAEDNNKMGNIFKDQKLTENARVQTTGNGFTTIRMKNGCRVEMKPREVVTIDSSKECKALIASIQSTVPVNAGAGASGFVGENPVGLIALAAGGIGAYFNMRQRGSGS